MNSLFGNVLEQPMADFLSATIPLEPVLRLWPISNILVVLKGYCGRVGHIFTFMIGSTFYLELETGKVYRHPQNT